LNGYVSTNAVLHERFHPVLISGGIEVKLASVDDVAVSGHTYYQVGRYPGGGILGHLVYEIFPFGRR
jgi:hypothetical protein